MPLSRLSLDSEPVKIPFDGLELHAVQTVEIQPVGGCVWIFLKRQDGSLLRVWVGPPTRQTRHTDTVGGTRISENRRVTRPLRVTVETDTLEPGKD